VEYRERLSVPASWWLIGMFFAVSSATAVGFAIAPWVSLVAGGLTAALVAVTLLGYGGVRIVVDDQGLTVGRYRLEARYLGEARAYDEAASRQRLGAGADRAAHLIVRGYIPTSVEVTIDDPADPHPYWLVSTRHPEELAAALARIGCRGE